MGIYGVEESNEHEDASARMRTGIYGQTLNIDGWFASHADTGRPGPHVRLGARGSTMKDPVLATSQIPELMNCLGLVAERIDRLWEREGDEYLRTFGDAPDDNDPAVIRQRRIDALVLNEKIAAHIKEIVELLIQAEDIHEATDSIAALLGMEDDIAVQVRLLNFSLFGLTRGARKARTRELQELREQP
jgi:hypothetical protein